jgi:hypothetical protein
MEDRAWLPWVTLRLLQRGLLLLLLLFTGTVPSDRGVTAIASEDFLRATARRWCQTHGTGSDLQVVRTAVHFRPEPPLFAEHEGVVVAPLAIDLAGSQRVLEVESQPGHLRKLAAQGITALAWEYGGRVRREMRFTGLALVERAPLTHPTLPEKPTFDTLPADLRPDALARVGDLEEHHLEKCAAFSGWARRAAGDPPFTAQIVRLVRAVAKRIGETKGEDDLCAAIRAGGFTPHWAQVAVVMGARELGIPAFGFASATAQQIFLVGTFVDRVGWILVDIERPEEAWFAGGPPLITMAPLLGPFSASQHGFWYPEAAAYAQGGWGVAAFSRTVWRGRLPPNQPDSDTTEAEARPLAEACR